MFGELQAFARELLLLSLLESTDIAYLYWIKILDLDHLILPPPGKTNPSYIGLLTIVSTSAFVLFIYTNPH